MQVESHTVIIVSIFAVGLVYMYIMRMVQESDNESRHAHEICEAVSSLIKEDIDISKLATFSTAFPRTMLTVIKNKEVLFDGPKLRNMHTYDDFEIYNRVLSYSDKLKGNFILDFPSPSSRKMEKRLVIFEHVSKSGFDVWVIVQTV